MKSTAILLLGMIAFLPTAYAADPPCVAFEHGVNSHLTSNQSCESFGDLCSRFSQCIRRYKICVVSDNKVLGGNTNQEIKLNEKSISFGVNQSFATKNHKYCVMAGMVTLGETGWYYSLWTPNGASLPGGTIYDGEPINKEEFHQRTLGHFNATIKELRVRLKSQDFNDGTYGFRKGEEP